MKELALTEIENEQIKKLFNTFFEVIQHFLDIKDKNRNLPFYKRKPDKDLRSLIENKEVLQSKHFDLFIKNIQALEKNQAYLDTTEWKVLAFLSPSLMDSKNPIAVYEALDYLNPFEFLGENNFSVIKVASIIYSLSQSEPLVAAKMLVRLDHFDLLTEQNLGKICANSQLNSQLFSSVLNKLSLIGESGGTSHLLTQANLDRLLENPRLNLDILAKLIQAENKSELLTQEKFDLAINLKNLLTPENIEKIEKTEFDPKMLADLLSLLDKAKLLTQKNFDSIFSITKADFEKLCKVKSKLDEIPNLTQTDFNEFLKIYLDAYNYDKKQQNPPEFSLIDRLCTKFLEVQVLTKNIFYKIINFFRNKINLHNAKQAEVKADLAANPNSFYASPGSRQSQSITDDEVLSPVNISNTPGVK